MVNQLLKLMNNKHIKRILWEFYFPSQPYVCNVNKPYSSWQPAAQAREWIVVMFFRTWNAQLCFIRWLLNHKIDFTFTMHRSHLKLAAWWGSMWPGPGSWYVGTMYTVCIPQHHSPGWAIVLSNEVIFINWLHAIISTEAPLHPEYQ